MDYMWAFPSCADASFDLYVRTPHNRVVQHQGIEVFLAPFSDISERYPEHAVPNTSPAFSSEPNESSIEAVDGERFVVVDDLLEDFGAEGSKMLKINHNINGRLTTTQRNYTTLSMRTRTSRRLQKRDTFESEVNKISGHWMKCGLTFAQLETGIFHTLQDEEILGRTDSSRR